VTAPTLGEGHDVVVEQKRLHADLRT